MKKVLVVYLYLDGCWDIVEVDEKTAKNDTQHCPYMYKGKELLSCTLY